MQINDAGITDAINDQHENHINAIRELVDEMEDQNYNAYLQRVRTLSKTSMDKRRRITENYYMNEELWKALKQYQRKGVAWIFKKYGVTRGCMLCDEPGLGKTVQTIAFI